MSSLPAFRRNNMGCACFTTDVPQAPSMKGTSDEQRDVQLAAASSGGAYPASARPRSVAHEQPGDARRAPDDGERWPVPRPLIRLPPGRGALPKRTTRVPVGPGSSAVRAGPTGGSHGGGGAAAMLVPCAEPNRPGARTPHSADGPSPRLPPGVRAGRPAPSKGWARGSGSGPIVPMPLSCTRKGRRNAPGSPRGCRACGRVRRPRFPERAHDDQRPGR